MFWTDRHLTPDDLTKTLRRDVAEGLAAVPKTLPPKWFYDQRGSALFDRITRLPEYYPTRAEHAALHNHAGEIVRAAGADTLVELGSGSGEKTRLLLEALRARASLNGFVPVDVSGEFLEEAATRIAAEYPDMRVHVAVADFERHAHLLPTRGRRLVAMLGSTIGNQTPEGRRALLADLHGTMAPGETLLLGLDLVKSRERLLAAYDDSRGVTAEFNRNVLHVVNRGLDADFEPDAFDHVACWNEESEWVEMRLRARERQRVHLTALDLTVDFASGEDVRTEISAKFRRDRVSSELARAGFTVRGWWTDPGEDFALVLAEV
ncbi:L-histidine N-alpha-methyltransferase [Haloactinospora alba]|uniref:Histidine N-alpha-methyltransferase n=1 Tax=Haloactinospora alba TaxID=405555 RepID=A0A543NGT3_9ACTN|nr:L-histidine N(alpha)-methyltransferase [Haloactinospora alba]TQN31004.1 L-histidine N-alpha-methyltransferase [Haloactinospora alba]